MSYTIQLRIFQGNPVHGLFSIVEETNWNYANAGTWSDTDGVLTLTMGGSGTSGVLRFKSDTTGEFFIVAVGVHNYKRWCDVSEVGPGDTALVVNGQYYNNGPRSYMRERQLVEYGGTSAFGTKVQVIYTVADGNNLKANVIIG